MASSVQRKHLQDKDTVYLICTKGMPYIFSFEKILVSGSSNLLKNKEKFTEEAIALIILGK